MIGLQRKGKGTATDSGKGSGCPLTECRKIVGGQQTRCCRSKDQQSAPPLGGGLLVRKRIPAGSCSLLVDLDDLIREKPIFDGQEKPMDGYSFHFFF